MAYTPYYTGGWQSGEEGGTPITPDALNHMEEGIKDANDLDATPTQGSTKGVQSGGVYTEIQQSTAKTVIELNESALSGRGTITGLYAYTAKDVVLNIIFTSSVDLSNSPRIITLSQYKPKHDCALACIDITSGIGSSINGSVPCGIGENGSVYIKECTSGHIYAITGTYIRA